MNIKQRGSNHYKTGKTEPIDLMAAGGILHDFAVGNIIKYAFRCRTQAKRSKEEIKQDLEKIKHYCDILLSFLEEEHASKNMEEF